MYYFIRLILLLSGGLLLFLLLILTGVLRLGSDGDSKQPKLAGWAIFAGLVVCFGAAICVPFESAFLTFDTAGEALRYSAIGSERVLMTRDCGDCVFTATHKGQLHTVDRRGERYTICDLHTVSHNYSPRSGDAIGLISCVALTNLDTSKTLYLVKISAEDLESVELNGEAMERLPSRPHKHRDESMLRRSARFVLVTEEPLADTLTLTANGRTAVYQ